MWFESGGFAGMLLHEAISKDASRILRGKGSTDVWRYTISEVKRGERERHLTSADFIAVFQMSFAEFTLLDTRCTPNASAKASDNGKRKDNTFANGKGQGVRKVLPQWQRQRCTPKAPGLHLTKKQSKQPSMAY
jgi:predicted secreted protein